MRHDKYGRAVVDPGVEGAYTQLGTKISYTSKKTVKYRYNQAREFDASGKPVRDIDFTDHNRADLHSNPHQHRWLENGTGGSLKRGDPEPLVPKISRKPNVFKNSGE